MWWNPWKRIRQLEARNTWLEDALEYEQEQTQRIVGNAIAAHYYRIQQENAYMLAQNKHMLETLSAINPLKIRIDNSDA